MSRIGFGVLMFPIHRLTHDPTPQLEDDCALAAPCDRLGYDEFRFGAGMLPFGASAALGLGPEHPMTTAWPVAAQRAERFGRRLDRRRWSVVSPMRLAETEGQARREVRWGLPSYIHSRERAALPLARRRGTEAG
ncbi:hypothetical protein ACQP1P_25125 [Dactylosporangium sp. CA-052675]|uniref:hypothetical protein n=1 Tax=Dactylosporangium sp. CA-052675 TaxID=3239927 RepID=UPI003D8ACF5E